MPAANLATLMDFETQIDDAIVAALAAASLTAYAAMSTTEKVMPFCSVKTHTITSIEHYETIAGILRPTMFSATVDVGVFTNRTETNGPANHKTYRGTVRNHLSHWLANQSGAVLNSRLSYLKVADFVEAGTSRDVDADNTADVTVFSFRLVFQIRPDAWPA